MYNKNLKNNKEIKFVKLELNNLETLVKWIVE